MKSALAGAITVFLLQCGNAGPVAMAQDTGAIYGKYNRGVKGDPQGASYLYVLKNHRYVIVFFGGAQTGIWELSKNNLVTFTPRTPAARFQLYGRHNPDQKDSTRICFQRFSDEETFIGTIGVEMATPLLQRVFNPDPNCFSYPYVYCFPGVKKDFVFADKPYGNGDMPEASLLYPFQNLEGYNDFIAAYFTPHGEYRPFMARLTPKGLAFSEEDIAPAGAIDAEEEREFLDAFNNANPDPDTVFFNPRYNEAPDVSGDTLNYTYNSKKQAYVSPMNYTEGEEYEKDADDFNRMNIVYPFRRLKAGVSLKREFTIAPGSLFQVSCR